MLEDGLEMESLVVETVAVDQEEEKVEEEMGTVTVAVEVG